MREMPQPEWPFKTGRAARSFASFAFAGLRRNIAASLGEKFLPWDCGASLAASSFREGTFCSLRFPPKHLSSASLPAKTFSSPGWPCRAYLSATANLSRLLRGVRDI